MDKLEQLQELLKSYGKVAVAYSGGVDSNFVLQVATKTLGKENVLAVTCLGGMMSKEDQAEAKQLVENIPHEFVQLDVLQVQAFRENWPDRCYHCKKVVMSHVIEEAKKHGIQYVLDGKNKDDESVYRPGMKAAEELGILSPLAKCELTKQEIRDYSKQLGISTYNKPSNACLATRFNYHTNITYEMLERIDQAEQLFHDIGIKHMRVRDIHNLARIEVEKQDFTKVLEHSELVDKLRELGFDFVTLDLEGIKSGSFDKNKNK